MDIDFSNPQKAIADIQAKVSVLLPNSGLTAVQKADISKVMTGTNKLSTIFNNMNIEDVDGIKSTIQQAEEMNEGFKNIIQGISDGVTSNR